jgi:predicted ATPase
MEPVIRRLIVHGFRSFRSEVVDFDNPTFLVGRNGSGKSNLVDALAFLSEAMVAPLPEVFSRRGGGQSVCHGAARLGRPLTTRTLGLGVDLGPIGEEVASAHYAFEIAPTRYDRSVYPVEREQCVVEGFDGRRTFFERIKNQTFRTSIGGLEPQLTEESLALPLVGGDARFAKVFESLAGIRAYSINPDKLREWQVPDSGWFLRADGSNASSVLRASEDHDRDDLQRICEILEAVVPAVERVNVKDYGSKLAIEFTQRWGDEPKSLTLEAASMSDGTLRALGLLAAVYQRSAPSLIAIEDPEATIHPGALGVILDVLRFASRRMQLVVTTHSPEVLDADWLEDRHIRIVTWQDGATRVTPLSVGSREALREHLTTAGELFRSNALNGRPPGPDSPQQSELFEDLAA